MLHRGYAVTNSAQIPSTHQCPKVSIRVDTLSKADEIPTVRDFPKANHCSKTPFTYRLMHKYDLVRGFVVGSWNNESISKRHT